MMDYNLNTEHKSTTRQAFIKMMTFMKEERKQLFFALSVMFINSCISLFTPYLIGYTVDHYIVTKLYRGLLLFCGLLLALYIISTLTQYIQIKLMGNIDQRCFTASNAVFDKIQQLPVAFFNQNKSKISFQELTMTANGNQFFPNH